MHRIIIHTEALTPFTKDYIESKLGQEVIASNKRYCADLSQPVVHTVLQEMRDTLQVDVNLLPPGFRPSEVKLVVSDMDSTFINIECIDEIADFAGVKPQVSKVTEAAMRGELNFEQSLTQRVALLKGLDESALQKVYDERLRLNNGAEQMLSGLKQRGIHFALVSGGFNFFTSRLQKKWDLEYTLSNTLEIADGKLTGRVKGNIVGAEAKANFLLQKCQELKISPQQAVAVGDGANDLKMMAAAGLGIAYRAKPKVQEQANCALNFSSLEEILILLDA